IIFLLRGPSLASVRPLSLHDALPICSVRLGSTVCAVAVAAPSFAMRTSVGAFAGIASGLSPSSEITSTRTRDALSAGVSGATRRSEEHTSELQSQSKLVCRLLPVKKL